MKRIIVFCFFLFFNWSISASAQVLEGLFDPVKSYVLEVDRVIKNSNGIGRYKSEGSIKTKDRNGVGGFSDYFYNHPESKKIIKITSGQTIHYGYDSKKIKKPITERIETELYYRNDSLIFAKIREEYYDTLKVFYSKETILTINDFDKDQFTSKPFQKEFVNWVLNLSDGYRSKYYKIKKENEELLKFGISK